MSINEDSAEVLAVYDAYHFPDCDVPYNAGRMKIFYPATVDMEGEQGPNRLGAPYPVVIFLVGGFIEMNRYQWLAERLVRDAKVVCVCCDAMVSLEDFAVLMPLCRKDPINSTAKALETALAKLHDHNENSKLAGMMDLNRIVLGGHSTGGGLALEYAVSEKGTEIAAVFCYGAHHAQFGDGNQEIFPRNVISMPTLLLVGNRDGVIERFSSRYGVKWTSAAEPVRRTFAECLKSDGSGIYIEFDDFNHFALVDPVDQTMGSVVSDHAMTVSKQAAIEELGHVITLFVQQHGHGDETAAKKLRDHLQTENAMIKQFEIRP